MGQSEVGGE